MVCLLTPRLHYLTTLDPDPSDFTLVLPRNDSQTSWGCIPPCSSMWPDSNTVFMWPVLVAEDKEAPLVVLSRPPLLEGNFLSAEIACVREVTGCHHVCVQSLSVAFFFFLRQFWVIFSFLILLLLLLFKICLFLASLCGMQDLSSPARGGTHALSLPRKGRV